MGSIRCPLNSDSLGGCERDPIDRRNQNKIRYAKNYIRDDHCLEVHILRAEVGLAFVQLLVLLEELAPTDSHKRCVVPGAIGVVGAVLGTQRRLRCQARPLPRACPGDLETGAAAAPPTAGRYRRREKDWRRPAPTLWSALSEIGIVARIECVTYRVENGTAESQRVYAGTGVVKDVRIAIKALRGARATVHRVGAEPAAEI